ncbi:hypothetical protein ACFQ0O_28370 [Saccharopolyspora spinosporotrichia]
MPIISFRSQQSALFTSLARVYAMTFLLNHVKKEYLHRHGGDDTEVNQLVSIAKALSSWEMSEVLHVCRERCGAQGMFSINRIADYLPMAQGVVTAEGTTFPCSRPWPARWSPDAVDEWRPHRRCRSPETSATANSTSTCCATVRTACGGRHGRRCASAPMSVRAWPPAGTTT